MTKDEALKLALVALEEARTNDDSCEKWDRNKKAITAIKEALAQPECARCKDLEEQAYDLLGQLKVANLKWSVAHPWVELTLEEVQDSYNPDYQAQTRAVEAKLKEKNT